MEKLKLDPDPDPHYIPNSGAAEAQNRAMMGHGPVVADSHHFEDQDPDPH